MAQPMEPDRYHEECLSLLGDVDSLQDWIKCHNLLHREDVTRFLIKVDVHLFNVFRNLLGTDIVARFGRLMDRSKNSISLPSLIEMAPESLMRKDHLERFAAIKEVTGPLITLRHKAIAHNDRVFRDGKVEYKPLELGALQAELEKVRVILIDLLGKENIPVASYLFSGEGRLTDLVAKWIETIASSERARNGPLTVASGVRRTEAPALCTLVSRIRTSFIRFFRG